MDRYAPMTLHRLATLIDAYGARPERWPDGERSAALRLLDESVEARHLRDQAACLDTLLDAAPEPTPSEALLVRIAAIPQSPQAPRLEPLRRAERTPVSDAVARPAPRTVRTPGRRARVFAAAASIVAVAGLGVWLTRAPEISPNATVPGPLAEIEVYGTTTDALLASDDLDLGDAAPAFGCTSAGDWGCPDLDVPQQESIVTSERSFHV